MTSLLTPRSDCDATCKLNINYSTISSQRYTFWFVGRLSRVASWMPGRCWSFFYVKIFPLSIGIFQQSAFSMFRIFQTDVNSNKHLYLALSGPTITIMELLLLLLLLLLLYYFFEIIRVKLSYTICSGFELYGKLYDPVSPTPSRTWLALFFAKFTKL